MRRYSGYVIFYYLIHFVNMQNLGKSDMFCNNRQGDVELQLDNVFSMLRTQMEEIRNLRGSVTYLEKEIRSLKDEMKINEDVGTTNAPSTNETTHYNITDLSRRAGQFGTEFYLTFPPVFGQLERIQLLLVSLQKTNVTITSDEIGLNYSVVLSNLTGLSIDLPSRLGLESSDLGGNVVVVSSDFPVAAYLMLISNSGAGDGYIAVPASRFKSAYFFSNNLRGFITIAAKYDTSFTVEVLTSSSGPFIFNSTNVGKARPFNINIHGGQTLQLYSNSHVIGKISGSKPFSALTGSYLDSSVSLHGHAASYVESLIGIENKIFIVPNFSNSTNKLVLCNSNTSTIDAISSVPVHKTNDFYIFIDGFKYATFLKTDTFSYCHFIGHGFSLSIPGISSYGSYFRYITPTVPSFYDHHAAVIIESRYTSGLSFKVFSSDGYIALSRTEQISIEGINYDVLYHNLGIGQYEVSHHNDTVKFMVLAYGFGTNASYAFPVGFV